MNKFTSFDQTQIAYLDQGNGPAVILLHGYGLNAQTNFGHFNHSKPLIEKNLALFKEHFGQAPPMPAPPIEGQPGLIQKLLENQARVIAPDLRGFGDSDKPQDPAAYANYAMAKDVIALLDHLQVNSADVLGFSMGALTALALVALHPPQIKSAILAGISEYVLDGSILEFPKSFPIPDYLPKPLTNRAWAEEGAKILEKGEVVPGHLASAHVVMAKAAGMNPKSLAAVLRGAIAPGVHPDHLKNTTIPVLVLNGKADIANQKVEALLKTIPTATQAQCEGDHYSTPYQPTFQQAVVNFFKTQWQSRGASRNQVPP